MFSAATPKKAPRRARRSQSRSLAGTPRPSPPGSVASSRLRDEAFPRTPRAYHAATDETLAADEDLALYDTSKQNRVLVADDSHSVTLVGNLPQEVKQLLSTSGENEYTFRDD
jgi:hypothetical protein